MSIRSVHFPRQAGKRRPHRVLQALDIGMVEAFDPGPPGRVLLFDRRPRARANLSPRTNEGKLPGWEAEGGALHVGPDDDGIANLIAGDGAPSAGAAFVIVVGIVATGAGRTRRLGAAVTVPV